VSVADGCDEGVDVGSGLGFGHRRPVWPIGLPAGRRGWQPGADGEEVAEHAEEV
jgi:hypothetical protein